MYGYTGLLHVLKYLGYGFPIDNRSVSGGDGRLVHIGRVRTLPLLPGRGRRGGVSWSHLEGLDSWSRLIDNSIDLLTAWLGHPLDGLLRRKGGREEGERKEGGRERGGRGRERGGREGGRGEGGITP